MRKFNYDENDDYYRKEVDRFFGDGDENGESDLPQNEEVAIQELQMSMFYRELNHRLVRCAIRMAEKSFFWRFCSDTTRLKKIDVIYKKLKSLEEE